MKSQPTPSSRPSPVVRKPPPDDPPAPRAAPRHGEPAPPPRPQNRTAAVAYLELIARAFRARRPGTEDAVATGSLDAPGIDHGGGEARGAIAAIDSAGTAGEALSGTSQTVVLIDTAPLRERIGRCLALHSHLTHAWSVTTRLRRDLAPSSNLVLACDTHGRLSLRLTSALPEVIAAIQLERPALAAVLAEWSTGEPEVEVRLVEAVA